MFVVCLVFAACFSMRLLVCVVVTFFVLEFVFVFVACLAFVGFNIIVFVCVSRVCVLGVVFVCASYVSCLFCCVLLFPMFVLFVLCKWIAHVVVFFF